MINEIIVIDDVISKTYQDAIEHTMFKGNFPFWYQFDSSFGLAESNFPSFNHAIVQQEKVYNNQFFMLLPLIYYACEKTNLKFSKVLSAKACIQEQLIMQKEDRINTPHVDLERLHTVVLYYVNDSDGETVIYNQQSLDNKNINIDKLTVARKVIPKKGRVVIFNGNTIHASSTPTKGPRGIVNFDII